MNNDEVHIDLFSYNCQQLKQYDVYCYVWIGVYM